MDLAPIMLTGRSVRVEPLDKRHAPDFALAAEAVLFRYLLD